MNSVLFDGSQHYLKLATGAVLTLSGAVGKLPKAAVLVKTYAPARLAQLLVANLERSVFSVPAALRSKLQALANSAPSTEHLQSESELIMASKSTAKKTVTKPAAKKTAAAKKPAAKKAASKAPSKKAAAAPAVEKSGRAPKHAGNAVITVISETNPKRADAAKRFDLYTPGITVDEYIAAGGKRADVVWDVKQGFISVAE